MNNYEYIISSLPAISLEWKFAEGASFASYVSWIKSQLSQKDGKAVDRLTEGWTDANLNREFYQAALKDSCRFIREYFTFDLNVRNGKARFLNAAFERPLDQDTIEIAAGEFAESAKLDAVLAAKDLLERERGLDALMWQKISDMNTFSYFDLDSVLGFIAKLHIIDRWFSLDEETGRDMFTQLLDEVRSTFKGVEYLPAGD